MVTTEEMEMVMMWEIALIDPTESSTWRREVSGWVDLDMCR